MTCPKGVPEIKICLAVQPDLPVTIGIFSELHIWQCSISAYLVVSILQCTNSYKFASFNPLGEFGDTDPGTLKCSHMVW